MSSLLLTGVGAAGAVADPIAALSPAGRWKADAITGKSDGDAVESWLDSSGNSKTMTQVTAAFQPIYKTNIANGKSVLRFDGSNDVLTIAEAIIAGSADYTLVWAAAPTNLDTDTLFSERDVGGTPIVAQVDLNGGQWRVTSRNDAGSLLQLATSGTSFVGGSWHIGSISRSGTNLNIWRDGAGVGTSAAAPAGATSVVETAIGSAAKGFGGHFAGDIAEVIVFPALSQANLDVVEASLGTTYGITVA